MTKILLSMSVKNSLLCVSDEALKSVWGGTVWQGDMFGLLH